MIVHNLLRRYAFVVFFAWALILSSPYFAFGPDSYVRIHDSADGRLATRLALKANLEDKEIGYRNPDMFGGIDRLAEGNSLEIINVLFYILPGWLAYAVFMFLQRLVAGFFTYKLLGGHFKIASIWAALPALYYALFPMSHYNNQFEGYVVPNAFTLAGIPMLLYGLLWIGKKTSGWKSFGLAFGLGLLFASTSNFAFSIFVFPFLAILLYIAGRRDFASIVILLGALFLGWITLEHQELIASALQAPSSNRILRSYCWSALGQPSIRTQFGELLISATYAPFFVVGIVGLALYINPHKKNLYFQLVLVTGLYLLLAGGSVFLPRFICSELLPFGFLEAFNFSRFSLLLPFTSVLILSFGLEYISNFKSYQKAYQKHLRYISHLSILIALTIGVAITIWTHSSLKQMLDLKNQGQTYRNIFENPYLDYLGELIDGEDEPGARAALVFHNLSAPVHPGYMWSYGINTIDGYTVIYPLRFWNFWNLVIDPMMSAYPECRSGIKFREGDNRAYLSTYCEIGSLKDELELDQWFDLNLLSLVGTKYLVSQQTVVHPDLVEIDTSFISCVFDCIRYKIYLNTSSFSFVHPYQEYSIVNNEEQLFEFLKDGEDLSENAYVLQSEIIEDSYPDVAPGDFDYSVLDYSADRLLISIQTDAPKLVQINIAYSPYWYALVDNRWQHVFSINHLLTGVFIPAGNHTLELSYSPPYSIFSLPRILFD